MKSPEAYKTISEVTEEVGVPQHVLRFWEAKFPIRPLKRGGNRRYYKPDDVRLVRVVNHLLYVEGFTIRGVQKLLRERGVATVVNAYEQHRQRMGSQLLQDMEAPAQSGDDEALGADGPAPPPSYGDSEQKLEIDGQEPESAAEAGEPLAIDDILQSGATTSVHGADDHERVAERGTRAAAETVIPSLASDDPPPYRAPVLDPLAQLRRQSRDLHQLREFLLMVQQNRAS